MPTIPDSANISDKACFSYVGKIPDDREFYFFSTIPDFAYIPDNRQKSVPDSPYYELGGKWKVCQLMLRRSRYICVLALVNARFSILKKQKLTHKTPYHSSSFLGKRFEIAMTRIFEKRPVYFCLFTIGGLEPSK